MREDPGMSHHQAVLILPGLIHRRMWILDGSVEEEEPSKIFSHHHHQDHHHHHLVNMMQINL